MQIKKNLLQYKRDTYLNNTNEKFKYKKNLSIIKCDTNMKSLWNSINLNNIVTKQIFQYPDIGDTNKLKKKLLKRYGNSELSINNIFLGHGAFNILERIIHKMINPNKMLGVGPQFNEIPSEFTSTGGQYFSLPLIENDFKLNKLYIMLRKNLYDILYIDNPNNPTGYVFDMEYITNLIQICDETGTILVIDEAYGNFLNNNTSAIQLVNKYNNIIVVRSFSKGFGLEGIRSGYMFTSNKIAKIYKEIDVPFEPSSISIRLSLLALSDKKSLETLKKNTFYIKQYLINELPQYNIYILPTHPYVPIFVAYSKNKNIYNYLQSINIQTINGEYFKNTYSKFDYSYARIHIPSSIYEAKQIINRIKTAS